MSFIPLFKKNHIKLILQISQEKYHFCVLIIVTDYYYTDKCIHDITIMWIRGIKPNGVQDMNIYIYL